MGGNSGKPSLTPISRKPGINALRPSTVTAMPATAAACSPTALALTQVIFQLRPMRSSLSIACSR